MYSVIQSEYYSSITALESYIKQDLRIAMPTPLNRIEGLYRLVLLDLAPNHEDLIDKQMSRIENLTWVFPNV